MSFKVINTEIITTLTIQFTTGSTTSRLQADSTPVLKVYKAGALVFRSDSPGRVVLNPNPGIYTHAWTPTESGQYKLVWSFEVSSTSYTQEESIFVLENATSTGTDADEPDVDLSHVCRVTGTFLDSGGNYRKGIQVRFSPSYDPHANTSQGFIVDDITAVTDGAGGLDMFIMRGIEGLLTITGVGLSRRVKIPDQSSIDIFELASLGRDSFEMQTPKYYEAPRRS